MSNLRNLFNKPVEKSIGDISFLVYKLAYGQFDDALVLGRWISTMDTPEFTLEKLEGLQHGRPERAALDRVVAGCLVVVDGTEPNPPSELQRLQEADVATMPLVMVAEALLVVMEVNADFFFRTLPRLAKTLAGMQSTGSALLSSLLAPATPPGTSSATP